MAMTIVLLCLSCNIAVFAAEAKGRSPGMIHSGEIKP